MNCEQLKEYCNCNIYKPTKFENWFQQLWFTGFSLEIMQNNVSSFKKVLQI